MALSPQAAYRKVLRTLRKHVPAASAFFEQRVADEFRKNAAAQPAVAEQKIKVARDCASLVNGVHYHHELLLSYNIAVDREAEKKARLRDTARRVGLQLPKVPGDNEEQEVQNTTPGAVKSSVEQEAKMATG